MLQTLFRILFSPLILQSPLLKLIISMLKASIAESESRGSIKPSATATSKITEVNSSPFIQ